MSLRQIAPISGSARPDGIIVAGPEQILTRSAASLVSPIVSYSPDTPPNNFMTPTNGARNSYPNPGPSDTVSMHSNIPRNLPMGASSLSMAPTSSISPVIPMFSPALYELIHDTNHTGTIPSKTSNVQLSLQLDRFRFVAGQEIEGRLQLVCSSGSKVKLGDMTVGVVGFEETHGSVGKQKVHRRPFLSAGLILQSGEVTSEASVNSKADPDGYKLAKKGRTAFGFRIQVPATCNMLGEGQRDLMPCPSSFWNDKFGGVRYLLAGTAFVKDGKSLKTKPQVIHVLQEIEVLSPAFQPPVDAFPPLLPESCFLVKGAKREFGNWMTKKGWVGLRAIAHVVGGTDGTWSAGTRGHVQVSASNWSERKMNTMRLTLVRQLRTKGLSPDKGEVVVLHNNSTAVAERMYTTSSKVGRPAATKTLSKGGANAVAWSEGNYSDEIYSSAYSSSSGFVIKEERWWTGVDQGENSRQVFEVPIPHGARTVSMKSVGLVEVKWLVQVAVGTSRDDELCVEIPVCILDPLSLLPTQPPHDLRPVTQEDYDREMAMPYIRNRPRNFMKPASMVGMDDILNQVPTADPEEQRRMNAALPTIAAASAANTSVTAEPETDVAEEQQEATPTMAAASTSAFDLTTTALAPMSPLQVPEFRPSSVEPLDASSLYNTQNLYNIVVPPRSASIVAKQNGLSTVPSAPSMEALTASVSAPSGPSMDTIQLQALITQVSAPEERISTLSTETPGSAETTASIQTLEAPAPSEPEARAVEIAALTKALLGTTGSSPAAPASQPAVAAAPLTVDVSMPAPFDLSGIASTADLRASTTPVRGHAKPQPKWEEEEVVLKLPRQRGQWMKQMSPQSGNAKVGFNAAASAYLSSGAKSRTATFSGRAGSSSTDQTAGTAIVNEEELAARIDMLMKDM